MRAKTLFLFKFLLLAGLLLPVWLSIAAKPYLQMLAFECMGALKALGYTILDAGAEDSKSLFFGYSQNKQPLSFEAGLITLNGITYVSLLLASARGLGWRRWLGFLAAGLAILNLSHVLYVVLHFYVAWHYDQSSKQAEILKSVSEVVYLLLPFLLWALYEAPRLFKRQKNNAGP